MELRQFRYRLVDVFAERPFSGAGVAVVTDARGLDTGTMQAIARELNREQTSFAFPPRSPSEPLHVRIFSPQTELPRAQCSTIATAFALDCERTSTECQSSRRVVFEGQDGPVSVSNFARVLTARQPAPELGSVYADVDAATATLGLAQGDCVSGAPVRAASSGVPFLVVPLRSRSVLQHIEFRKDIWERTVRLSEAPKIIAFTLEAERAGSTAKMRVFSPDIGVLEEAATEMACGPLAAYLVRYGFLPTQSPQLLVFEQGSEVCRPSLLHAAIERDGDRVTSVRVGGQCVSVGEGTISAPARDDG